RQLRLLAPRRARRTPGRDQAPPLHGRTAADLRPVRPGDRRAGSVGLPAPVQRCAPGRDHPLLCRPSLAGHDRDVSAAGGGGRPPSADEHLPRQMAGVPGRAGPCRRHTAPGVGLLPRQEPGMTFDPRVTPLSVLDLAQVCEGSDVTAALDNTVDLARHTEALGYNRFWLAEHHNMPGIASAATAVLIAQVAAHTRRIRVGAGGIMLPNHSPLQVAEQFGTLAALHPGRIDLAVGRAPGTDQATARALRRYFESADRFPQDVQELLGYFAPVQPGQAVQAVPRGGLEVPVWVLGSSLFGAQLAAALGLPYAFASHFAPDAMEQAMLLYHRQFQPSRQCPQPYVMLAVNVV